MQRVVGRKGGIVLIGLDTSALVGPYSHNTTQAPPSRNSPHGDVSGFEAQGSIEETLPISYGKLFSKHHQADKEVFPGVIAKANIKGNAGRMVGETQCLQPAQGGLRGRKKYLGVGGATQVDDPHGTGPELGQQGFERAERVGR